MEKEYLIKTRSVLQDLVDCLHSQSRKNFYSVNANIYSLMFDGPTLKPSFSIMLPNELSGYFTNMMWSISRTGAYFGNVINGYQIKDIVGCIEKILSSLDKELLKLATIDKNDFYTNLITACSLMQTNYFYHTRVDSDGKRISVCEDCRNYFLRDLFDYRGLYVRGQEHQGVSPNGKGSGEVDILVCRTGLQPKIYIEGLNLGSLESNKIDNHYEKLFLYDSSMNAINYLVSYVETSDFERFCCGYKEHFEKYKGNSKCSIINDVPTDYANIKVFVSASLHEGKSISTYHVLAYFETYQMTDGTKYTK